MCDRDIHPEGEVEVVEVASCDLPFGPPADTRDLDAKVGVDSNPSRTVRYIQDFLRSDAKRPTIPPETSAV